MGILETYSTFLVCNPIKLLSATISTVLLLFAITLYLRPLQSFNDPLIGFEARGTDLGAKLNTWRLLSDETSASSNNISIVPNWPHYDGAYSQINWSGVQSSSNEIGVDMNNVTDPEPPIIESSIQKETDNVTNFFHGQDLDPDEEEYYRMINSTRNGHPGLMHHSLGSSKAFCGSIQEGYAQAVVAPSPSYMGQGLFNLDSLRAICELDRRLRMEHTIDDVLLFQNECELYQNETVDTCCNSWSLPNYIACLNEKSTCIDLSNRDIRNFEKLLDLCIPYYLRAPYEDCFHDQTDIAEAATKPRLGFLASSLGGNWCGNIPGECLKCGGWTYNVLHYLVSENFLKHKSNPGASESTFRRDKSQSRPNQVGSSRESYFNKLSHTNIFLPMAKSASIMQYYLALTKHSLKTPYAQVKVLNLGLKNSLFEHLISDDLKLLIIALVSILLVISVYTWSFVLSLVILMIICLSLCLSYTIYELILNIEIFPFMNLLAVVISFGICSDNAMLFCKHWSLSKEQIAPLSNLRANRDSGQNVTSNKSKHLEMTVRRAILSTSAATLATACSFVIGAISHVTAVRCFCIFATLTVITNYLLIAVLLPPALILDVQFKDLLSKFVVNKDDRMTKLSNRTQALREKFLQLGDYFHQSFISTTIREYKYYLMISFTAFLICSSILVFHGPTLQPADDEVQLFTRKHVFEQYDKNVRRQFAFERVKQGEMIGTSNNFMQDAPDTLPIRVVFGIIPSDNGDTFDPQDRGTLVFDRNFDIAEPNAQIWMLDFCLKLRNQRFVHPSSVIDKSNCFMETFKSWMESRKCADPIHPELDRNPCCESSEFPFSRGTFNKCMLEAVSMMRRSPHLYPNVNAGVRFHKNSTRIAALIVEYHSNRLYSESFSKMDRFYHEINEWVTWNVNNTAPVSLRSGWFVSNNLELYALQTELEQSICVSVFLEVLFAMFALLLSTRDVFLTLAGTLTITTVIIIILAILVLLKWTLGVAESILVSLTIGLSIDFALHYSVAYSEGIRSRHSTGVIQRILTEVGSPIALATTTTTLAGFAIVWSDILAYQELGTFLMLIALVSWLTSTFFLLPMLATFDSIRNFTEHHTRMLIYQAQKMLLDRL